MQRLRAAVSWLTTGAIAVGLVLIVVTSSRGVLPASSGIVSESGTTTTIVHLKVVQPSTRLSPSQGIAPTATVIDHSSVAASASRKPSPRSGDETPAPVTTNSAVTTSTSPAVVSTTTASFDDGGEPGTTGTDH
jgi:hypothetical protein